MDRCICCGRELDYEGTLICWECEKFGKGGDRHATIHHPGQQLHCGDRGGRAGLPLEENSKNIVANAQ